MIKLIKLNKNQEVRREQPQGTGKMLKRLIPVVVLVAGLAAFFLLGLHERITLESLSDHQDRLKMFVREHLVLAMLSFMITYAVATAFSLPVGLILSLAGGWLFGLVWGTVVIVLGATVGACVLFLAARYALGDMLRGMASGWLDKFRRGFQDNALSYMLTIRFVPLFPFWLGNLAPAFLGVKFTTYTFATLIGIIPGSFVYASVGNGFASVFRPDINLVAILLDPAVVIPIAGLIVLSLIPVVYRRFLVNRNPEANSD